MRQENKYRYMSYGDCLPTIKCMDDQAPAQFSNDMALLTDIQASVMINNPCIRCLPYPSSGNPSFTATGLALLLPHGGKPERLNAT